jgi:hypothetical protein
MVLIFLQILISIFPQITKLVKNIGYMTALNFLHAAVHLISCIKGIFFMPLLDFSCVFPNVNACHYLLHDVIYPINDLHVAVSCSNLFPA